MASDHRRLIAATASLLEAYKAERQAVFECVSNRQGVIDDIEGQLLVSIMDDIIAETEAALAPFLPRKVTRSGVGSPSRSSSATRGSAMGQT